MSASGRLGGRLIAAHPAPTPEDGAGRPTAAAPTSGPSAPSPAGMIRVDREKSSPHRSPDLLLGGVEERRHRTRAPPSRPPPPAAGPGGWPPRPPPGRRASRQRRRMARAGLRGRSAGHRLDRQSGRLGLETAAPAAHAPAARRARPPRGRCARRSRPPRRAAGRRARCRPRCRSTPPWPDSRRAPGPRPAIPRRGPVPWRRCRRPPGARRQLGQPRRAAGTGAMPRMLSGDTVSPPGRHRATASDPAGHRGHGRPVEHLDDGPGQRGEDLLGVGRRRASAHGPGRAMRPPRVDDADLHLGAADVDGQDGRQRRVPPGPGRRRPVGTVPRIDGHRPPPGRRRLPVVSRRGGSAHGSSHGDRGRDC